MYNHNIISFKSHLIINYHYSKFTTLIITRLKVITNNDF